MTRNTGTGELDDLLPLTDLIVWMNAQPRRPGEERTVWRHENARQQLELIGLRFLQKAKGHQLFFRKSELRKIAPNLAHAFLDPPPPPDADAALA